MNRKCIINRAVRVTTANNILIRNYCANVNNKELKSWKEIPGPPSLPLIGQLHHFLPKGLFYDVKGLELFDKLYKTYGPIIRLNGLLGRPPIIFVMDPKSAAQVLRGENWLPARPGFQSLEYYRKYYKKGHRTATGLLTEHGEEWKKFRSTVNPALLQPKTIKLYEKPLEEVANEMILRMKSKKDKNDMIQGNLDTEMNLWALESIGVVALGSRLNCLDHNLPEDSPARQLIQCVHDVFVVSNELDFGLSFWRYFPTKSYKKAMKIYETLNELAKHFIKKGIANISSNGDEKGVLEKLIKIDENVAHIMASDMLFAGVDTTANTIITTLYLLAISPEKQEKLREEIIAKKERKYLKACLKESMRILPVTGGNLRQVTKDHHVLGYLIPKDMMVTTSHQYMSSCMENQYPKPSEYIPERWIVSKDDPLYHGNAEPLTYSPFGFGVRSCIGRRIAELELETFLTKIIENFRVEWFGPPLKIKSISLNYVQGPFNFKFRDI